MARIRHIVASCFVALLLCIGIAVPAYAADEAAAIHVDTPEYCIRAHDVTVTAEDIQSWKDHATVLTALISASDLQIRYRDAQQEYDAWKVFDGTVQGDIGAVSAVDLTRAPVTCIVPLYIESSTSADGFAHIEVRVTITDPIPAPTPVAPAPAVTPASAVTPAAPAATQATPAVTPQQTQTTQAQTPVAQSPQPAQPESEPPAADQPQLLSDASDDIQVETTSEAESADDTAPGMPFDLTPAETVAVAAAGGVSAAVLVAFVPGIISSVAALYYLRALIAKQRKRREEEERR